MELSGKIGADIGGPTDDDLDVRPGVRALLGTEGAADGLGDGAAYLERRGLCAFLGVVSPDLGRVEPTDVARDVARDKPLDVIVARD